MRPGIGVAFAILLILASLLCADSISIGVSISPNEKLITATGNLAFPAVLPGYNYTGNVTVNWAVPKDSLRGLQADEVIVYVRASVPRDSGIILEAESDSGSEVLTTLTCKVQNLNCVNDSMLSRQIRVLAPSSRNRNFSGNVSIEASLAPFRRTNAGSTPTGLIDSLTNVDNTFSDLLSQKTDGGQNASNNGTSQNGTGTGNGGTGTGGSQQGEGSIPAGMKLAVGDALFPVAAGLIVVGIIAAGYFLSRKQE